MHRTVSAFVRATTAATCLVLAAPLAFAQVPALQGQGAVRHVCGGIGSDESTAFRAAMKDHPLSLLFARASGDYLADVQVDVQDAQGKSVLSTKAAGPVCLVDLPKGTYTVHASAGSGHKVQTVTVDGTPRTADFRF
ncbi:hypothetical protein [Xylophilus sp. Leaf220]|uniref:hypothetical protein n=1 Tax=Xylophilus sp. Leaf220 TaxID=1735686 RepID=UPI0007020B7E|nr:hypothetical protein [Xylophilus sp. Leaf220]KQM78395.1 hypothetical protein ASE76_17200 [Xylophilus sp. Leaf220]